MGTDAVAKCTPVRVEIFARYFLIVVGAVFVLWQTVAAQAQEPIRRVLLSNDFGYMASPGIEALDQAIVTALEESPYQIELYNETLESTLFSDEATQRRIRAWILLKYSGRKPDVIITAGPASLRCDWRALRRWRLSEKEIPAGSIVLYRESSIWERPRAIWVGAVLIIVSLCALAAYLQFSRKELRLARDAQMQLSGRLIGAQEKERSRLAAELHDDFSQRLALLALGLENASEALPDSPHAAKQQLQELIKSAGELGADIHTVSHRLHSATLESLGLVPGVGSLCKEFTNRHGIDIAFSAEDIPRVVDPDVSLCLFRIVQEALQNLKKHSGAVRGEVKLVRRADRISVSVSDQGKGFDMGASKACEGLGLRSMEERARLQRGNFQMDSKPGRGTRVQAVIPLPSPNGSKSAGRDVSEL